MVTKRLLRPERLRTVPSQFSWLDHRLVRERHLERCSTEALALYLFLVTVADAMIRRCVETGLPEPEFAVADGFVTTIRRVVIPRRESGQTMGAAVAATGRGPVGYGVPVQDPGPCRGPRGPSQRSG